MKKRIDPMITVVRNRRIHLCNLIWIQKVNSGLVVDKCARTRYYCPATKKRQRKFLGKWHLPADGVTLSGVRYSDTD